MIRTLDRMVVLTFTWLFTVFAMSVPIVFILGDLSDQQGRFLDRGLSVLDIAHGYLFMYPHFILLSAPVAALVAAVFTVHSMTAHREIQAAKAGGISFHRLVAPLWPVGAALTGGAFLLASIVPGANRRAAEIFGEREMRREWRHDFVYQTENEETLSVQQLFIASNSMDGVLMESWEEDGSLRHVWADEAVFADGEGWTFRQGYLRVIRPGGTETTYAFERYRPLNLMVAPEELLDDPPEEEEMSYGELGRQAAAVFRSGGDPKELLVAREQKLAIPAAILVIVLFGTPLATTVKKGGAAFGVGVSLGSTLFYILLLRLFGAIGAAGGMPPFWAAWMPNVLFLAVGIVLLIRVRT